MPLAVHDCFASCSARDGRAFSSNVFWFLRILPPSIHLLVTHKRAEQVEDRAQKKPLPAGSLRCAVARAILTNWYLIKLMYVYAHGAVLHQSKQSYCQPVCAGLSNASPIGAARGAFHLLKTQPKVGKTGNEGRVPEGTLVWLKLHGMMLAFNPHTRTSRWEFWGAIRVVYNVLRYVKVTKESRELMLDL
eukprot:2211320-Amphidinium_carterae.1